ncbi:MAG: Gfo/Idh/MocA family oxidoreductase [Armatimonadetes bacterium]|nr:Gfo/Idh/MocA family oxidoreductase [Armatimonadota bacterium]
MANELRIGVIGCGAIHGNHCDSLQRTKGGKLAAVCDVLSEKAQAAGAKFGVTAVSSLDELWPLVDAVTVCVPSGDHAKIGVEAAKRGKHVLTEKPVDIKLGPATALADACDQAGVVGACVSQHRFAHDIQQLRDAAQGGGLGRLIQGDAYIKWYRTQAYYDSGDWRGTWALDGGGCLMNQGVHYVDMLQWVMGGVKSVQAQVRTAAHDIEVEDIATALLEFDNGAIGVLVGSTSAYPGISERLEVHGTGGSVFVEADKIKTWETIDVGGETGPYGRGITKQPVPNLELMGEEEAASGASDPSAIWGEQHFLQIQDFIDAVHEGRKPMLSCREALEPLKVILAVYESARMDGARVKTADVS